MRFEQGQSREEVLAELQTAAEQRWGRERLPQLDSALETAANALWQVAKEPLDLLEAEPDFIAGGPRRHQA
jgi:hypothetical protein